MSNLRIEYRRHAGCPAGVVILGNDLAFSPEEIRVLFQFAMRRYQRFADVISFVPAELGWPELPDVGGSTTPEREALHELGRISRISALPTLAQTAGDLVNTLDAMIDSDRQWREASR